MSGDDSKSAGLPVVSNSIVTSMVCNCSKQKRKGKVLAELTDSVPPERNVFESIHPRRHVLRINKLRVRNVVFANAACAVKSEHVFGQATVNDTFPTQTGHIRDPGECRAVSANRRVGRKRVHATTTFVRNRFISLQNNIDYKTATGHLQLSRS